jgi:hypothetical protein
MVATAAPAPKARQITPTETIVGTFASSAIVNLPCALPRRFDAGRTPAGGRNGSEIALLPVRGLSLVATWHGVNN